MILNLQFLHTQALHGALKLCSLPVPSTALYISAYEAPREAMAKRTESRAECIGIVHFQEQTHGREAMFTAGFGRSEITTLSHIHHSLNPHPCFV